MNSKLLATLSVATLLLAACGGGDNPASSTTTSATTSEDTTAIKAEALFAQFAEKCESNNATIKVEEISKKETMHISDYYFFGEKAQYQAFTPEMKETYATQYPGETLADSGILINGDQGAFAFTLDESGDVNIGSPLGQGKSLQELSAYGPAMLGNRELYTLTEEANHFDSATAKDAMAAASYWLPVLGLRSSYASMANDFDLFISDDLAEIVCTIELVDDNGGRVNYRGTVTAMGTTTPTGKLATYLASPDYLPAPSTFQSTAASYLATFKEAGAALPFPTGVDAQYDEAVYDGVLQIVDSGKNLVKTYTKQLTDAGFEAKLVKKSDGSYVTQYNMASEAKEGDLSYKSASLTVMVTYSSKTTYIVVMGRVLYRDLAVANEQLLAWNSGVMNTKYQLNMNYAALGGSEKILSVESEDMTTTYQSVLAQYGLGDRIYFAWGASVEIASKEDAIAWAAEQLTAHVNASFTNDGNYTLDGKGYAYCYKTEATYGTEIALKFSLLNDDKGEYSGIVSVEAMVGYYEIIDMFMKVDPNAE